jgi:hypothetical protein
VTSNRKVLKTRYSVRLDQHGNGVGHDPSTIDGTMRKDEQFFSLDLNFIVPETQLACKATLYVTWIYLLTKNTLIRSLEVTGMV